LKAKGYEVGKSLVDTENYNIKEILKSKKLIIPEHVIVKDATGKFTEKSVTDIAKDDVILDIGSKSVKVVEPIIKSSKLILWNGPLGKYEAGGGGATKQMLKLVVKSKAQSIIGGGDTVSLISEMKMEKSFSFVSTGGGATLDFLSSGTLPGIKALK
jgi:phosphoglycerate kinase